MKEFDVKFTFWTYLTVRVMIGVIGGTAFAMFEGNFQYYHLIFLILGPHFNIKKKKNARIIGKLHKISEEVLKKI